MSKNSLIRVCVSYATLVLLVALGTFEPVTPSPEGAGDGGRPRMADSLWIEDIEYFVRELPELHNNLFFKMSREQFETRVTGLRKRVPELANKDIAVALMRILAEIGDSHTMLGVGASGIFTRLPIRMEWYSDGLYVVGAARGLESMLGKRVLGIEGRKTEEVGRLVTEVIPHDNDAQIKKDGPRHMAIPEILAALGIAGDPDTVAFDIESLGEVKLGGVAFREKISWVSVMDSLGCEPPFHLRNPDTHYWFAYLENDRLLYLKYGACREMKDRPMEAFTEEVLGFVDTHPVEKFVFDLRHNGGGNSGLARNLIAGVKERRHLNRRGHLFVVVGGKTFSSAIINALELMDGDHAVVIGEETGGKPNHYGEVRVFVLPNSMLPVQYSTKYFSLYPKDLPSIYPDVEVLTSFEDVLACRDPVLEAILEYDAP